MHARKVITNKIKYDIKESIKYTKNKQTRLFMIMSKTSKEETKRDCNWYNDNIIIT